MWAPSRRCLQRVADGRPRLYLSQTVANADPTTIRLTQTMRHQIQCSIFQEHRQDQCGQPRCRSRASELCRRRVFAQHFWTDVDRARHAGRRRRLGLQMIADLGGKVNGQAIRGPRTSPLLIRLRRPAHLQTRTWAGGPGDGVGLAVAPKAGRGDRLADRPSAARRTAAINSGAPGDFALNHLQLSSLSITRACNESWTERRGARQTTTPARPPSAPTARSTWLSSRRVRIPLRRAAGGYDSTSRRCQDQRLGHAFVGVHPVVRGGHVVDDRRGSMVVDETT